MQIFAQALGDSYSVQQFLQDMLYSFSGFAPYVITGAVVLGVLNWLWGAAFEAVRLR